MQCSLDTPRVVARFKAHRGEQSTAVGALEVREGGNRQPPPCARGCLRERAGHLEHVAVPIEHLAQRLPLAARLEVVRGRWPEATALCLVLRREDATPEGPESIRRPQPPTLLLVARCFAQLARLRTRRLHLVFGEAPSQRPPPARANDEHRAQQPRRDEWAINAIASAPACQRRLVGIQSRLAKAGTVAQLLVHP